MNSCIFFEIQKMFGNGSRFPRDWFGNGSVKSGKLFFDENERKIDFFCLFFGYIEKKYYLCTSFCVRCLRNK